MKGTPREGSSPPGQDENQQLFVAYRASRRTQIRDRLVQRHENLARYLAGKFANRGEPLEDLAQVAMIGLLNAIERFDPGRGVRFSTYATPTIVGEIKRHFRDRAWNLKVPRYLQELNQRAVRANDRLTQQLGRSPTIAEVAAYLGCSEEEALHAMEIGAAYETISLDATLAADGEASARSLNESLGVEDLNLAQVEFQEDLQSAIRKLDNREQLVIQLRFFQELSQTEVARRLNVSQMHVSRLQQGALRRLKSMLGDYVGQGRMEAA